MLERIRTEFRSEDQTTLLVLGLSMVVVGGLTASTASEVGIGPVFGAVLLVCGILVLGGTVVWGTEAQAR